jgi:hypothetical protein
MKKNRKQTIQILMTKKAKIKAIKKIIADFGIFSLGEVEGADGICVGELGSMVGLAEEFKLNEVVVNVYKPSSFSSDPIDDYEKTYEELSSDVLTEILLVAEMYEADQLKTEKRISN